MTAITERLSAALAGRYRIERHISEGGMATVYLCDDLKHDRKVALKLLKPELAAVLGAERFVQEIKTTAALQHPHILPLFDSGTADGFLFYVMPFIDGETLREKLTRERQLSIDEAVRIAREVLDALHYAHEHGIVHRDVKPENILLHGGHAMVADFGIALAVSAAAGGRMTETGLSLGTPHYMSPEQATAEKEITARSDVYSLGSVLYEMLAGQPPHLGGAAQQVIMKIITEPAASVTQYRKSVPPNVAAAVAKALEKLPADRFTSAKEFADALNNPAFTVPGVSSPLTGGAARRRWYTSPFPWVAALVVSLAALAWQATRNGTGEASLVRFVVKPPPDGLVADRALTTSISGDGRRIAFMARAQNTRRIYVQDLARLEARALPGTEEARYFALSPDGQSLVFQAGAGGVYRVAVEGGAVTGNLLPADVAKTLPSGIAWTNHTIVVSLGIMGVVLVPESGGPARRIAVRKAGQPCSCAGRAVLGPDGEHIFLAGPSAYVIPLAGGEVQDLGVAAEMIVAVRDNLIVYLTADGTLMAAPIDLRTLKVGAPVAMESQVMAGSSPALAANGTLVMFTGASGSRLELVDEHGVGKPIVDAASGPNNVMFPRYSPDGRRIAVATSDRLGSSAALTVSIIDIASGTTTRLTTDFAADRPEWSPDGRRVLFRRYQPDREEIWWQPFDRSGAPEPLQVQTGADLLAEGQLSPDGKWLMYRPFSKRTGRDIWYRAMSGDTASKPFEVTAFDEVMPRFSPDGRWVAYTSNESGAPEVFVRPFPGPGGRTPISSGGGTEPVWAPDGRRLYYVSGTDFMAAALTTGGGLTVASRDKLFNADFLPGSIHANYDVAKDGRHFLMLRSAGGSSDLTVALSWFGDAKRRLTRLR